MLTKEQLKHLAELAKIEFTDKELNKFLIDFNTILGYIEEIKKLDLSKFEPMIGGPVQKLKMREDNIHINDESIKKLIINQFPQRTDNCLQVPKIIAKS